MGILRHQTPYNGSNKSDKAEGIVVNCPRCRANVVCSDSSGDSAIRCFKCNYPMIRYSDIMQIIKACKNVETNQQANCAVSVLKRLASFMPEACTALGMLPAQQKFAIPLSEGMRWNLLVNAYAAGDIDAKQGLNLMRQSSPELYGCRRCRSCGAAIYFEKNSNTKTVCPYCQSAD